MESEFIKENFQQFPFTMEIEKSLKHFESGYHAVSIIEGITSNFIGNSEIKFLTIEQFKRVEKGMIILCYSMLCNYYPLFITIPNERRLKFLQWFSKQFCFIHTYKIY
ncbi:hypothetical protein Mgra_00009288 [Meloidogyne graminicola]|uniref:Uncharacterized protein n=1 Tax=Meloidogyne graminicola TaxID=189291 RepID=A0A8S9ZBW1_9BILA|nr:hypothetical protein Mgra_00009288 [Meloidogyne graminicola]